MLPSLANARDRKRLGIVGMVKPVRRPGTLAEILPIFTAPQNQVNALHALGAKSFDGATSFPNDQNAVYARYFKEAASVNFCR
jgi:hypothetical protein